MALSLVVLLGFSTPYKPWPLFCERRGGAGPGRIFDPVKKISKLNKKMFLATKGNIFIFLVPTGQN